MYMNLKAEMARRNLTAKDLARVIGKSERSARDKLRGVHPFSIGEAVTIRDKLIPDHSLEYLFGLET